MSHTRCPRTRTDPGVARTVGHLAAVCVIALSCVAAPAPSPRPTASGADADIRRAREAQNAAIAARNADSVASFWIEDVTVSAGLGYVVRGRAAYKAAFGQDAPMVYSRVPEKIVSSPHWPLAWEEGAWTGVPSGAVTPIIGGRYSAQWVKQNGRWMIRSELFVALECSGVACGWPIRLDGGVISR